MFLSGLNTKYGILYIVGGIEHARTIKSVLAELR